MTLELPESFDVDVYRSLHGDLRSMTGAEARAHYLKYGIAEGRRAHVVADRRAFAKLVEGCDLLELGPFCTPMLKGPRVRYFDILDRDGLLERATRLGKPTENVPEHVHYVSPEADLSVVDANFDVVFSSHVIEHQPDLVQHLRAIERLLRPGGAYLLLVPDQRYCFDHYLTPSTISDVLNAHHEKRRVHTLQSQIEHEALTTHNQAPRHWRGDHGSRRDVVERTRESTARFRAEPELYVDVHAWYFTPDSFEAIIGLLNELGLTNLHVWRVYPTLRDTEEFWAVLRGRSPG